MAKNTPRGRAEFVAAQKTLNSLAVLEQFSFDTICVQRSPRSRNRAQGSIWGSKTSRANGVKRSYHLSPGMTAMAGWYPRTP